MVDQCKSTVFAKLPCDSDRTTECSVGPSTWSRVPVPTLIHLLFFNIAQAQTSNGAVFLLALNSLTSRGGRFAKEIKVCAYVATAIMVR